MEHDKQQTAVLIDLIALNDDRIKGYHRAISLLNNESDQDLVAVFEKYMMQAQQFKAQLIPLAHREGGEEALEEPPAEYVCRSWLEVGDTHEHGPRKTVLTATIKGEEHVQQIYRKAFDEASAQEKIHVDIIKSQADLQRETLKNLQFLLEEEMDRDLRPS